MRRELRYRLDVPARFSWESSDRRCLHGEGITRDISVLGAFIVTPTCPPLETPVQVEVILPSLGGMKSVIQIKGEARVVRVQHPSGDHRECGFAVVREDQNQWSLALIQNNFEDYTAVDLGMAGKWNGNWGRV